MNDTELLALSIEMNSQDNRSTQLPLFVVQQKEKVYGDNGSDLDWMSDDWEVIDKEQVCASCISDGYYASADCEECKCGRKTPMLYSWEWIDKLHHGVFLTGKSCDAYIKRRRYEFGEEVRSFGISSYWSDDMARLLAHVSSLSTEDKKPVSHYRI